MPVPATTTATTTTTTTTTPTAAEDGVGESPDDFAAPEELQAADDHGGRGHDTHHQWLVGRQGLQVAQVHQAHGQPAEHAQREEAEREAEARRRADARVPLLELGEVPAGRVSGSRGLGGSGLLLLGRQLARGASLGGPQCAV